MMREPSVTVIQGQQRLATREQVMLSTLLGSCVAACLWDEDAQVGGMNHFLLPAAGTRGGATTSGLSCGVHAMELLINALLTSRARRRHLQAKLFGGAAIRTGLTDIGDQNAAFAERFLDDEGIRRTGGSLRGDRGRRLQFWPMSGRARQSFITDFRTPAPASPTTPDTSSGDLELF